MATEFCRRCIININYVNLGLLIVVCLGSFHFQAVEPKDGTPNQRERSLNGTVMEQSKGGLVSINNNTTKRTSGLGKGNSASRHIKKKGKKVNGTKNYTNENHNDSVQSLNNQNLSRAELTKAPPIAESADTAKTKPSQLSTTRGQPPTTRDQSPITPEKSVSNNQNVDTSTAANTSKTSDVVTNLSRSDGGVSTRKSKTGMQHDVVNISNQSGSLPSPTAPVEDKKSLSRKPTSQVDNQAPDSSSGSRSQGSPEQSAPTGTQVDAPTLQQSGDELLTTRRTTRRRRIKKPTTASPLTTPMQKHDDEPVEADDDSEKPDDERRSDFDPSKQKLKKQSSDDEPSSSVSFMTYFIVFTVMVVMVYISFHNRQRIFACIIEGRRSSTGSRRRPGSSAEYRQVKSDEKSLLQSEPEVDT